MPPRLRSQPPRRSNGRDAPADRGRHARDGLYARLCAHQSGGFLGDTPGWAGRAYFSHPGAGRDPSWHRSPQYQNWAPAQLRK